MKTSLSVDELILSIIYCCLFQSKWIRVLQQCIHRQQIRLEQTPTLRKDKKWLRKFLENFIRSCQSHVNSSSNSNPVMIHQHLQVIWVTAHQQVSEGREDGIRYKGKVVREKSQLSYLSAPLFSEREKEEVYWGVFAAGRKSSREDHAVLLLPWSDEETYFSTILFFFFFIFTEF